MKLIIDISEDVYTRLFDNGIQDNEIAIDDVCEMARALRIGTPLDNVMAELKKIADDKWNRSVGSVSQGLEDAIEILDNIGKGE